MTAVACQGQARISPEEFVSALDNAPLAKDVLIFERTINLWTKVLLRLF